MTRSRPGGRTARTHRRVLDAVIEQLEDVGPGGLTMTAVAARSGVNASTLYRRWQTIDRLVFDALLDAVDTAIPVPDLGALDLDVRALLGALADFYRRPLGATIGRLAVVPSDDGAAERVRRDLWSARIEAVGEIVRRAVARGEMPEGTDIGTAVHVLLGPLHLAMISLGADVTPELLDRLAAAGLGALGWTGAR